MQPTIQQPFSIAGRMVTDVYNTENPRAAMLEKEIEHHILNPDFLREHDPVVRARMQKNHRKIYQEMIAEMQHFFKVREYVADNLIVTVGRAALAKVLANDSAPTGIINYGALGSSTTAATNGDTTLGTETYRKAVASTSTSNNIAFIDFFYSKSDTNGTYEEFGTFIDGTGTTDSGTMFTHLITGGWTKTSSESMTVACQYTIT